MPKYKRLKKGSELKAMSGYAVYLTHEEWSRISDYSDWAGFLAGVIGVASPIALAIATISAPYFLLAKYKEKRWGRRGIVFHYVVFRQNSGDIPTFHSPDLWDDLTSEDWEEY